MAKEAGLTRGLLRRLVTQGCIRRLHVGVFALVDQREAEDEYRLAIRAALLAIPGSHTVLDSSVFVHGLPLPAPSRHRVHVNRKGATYRRMTGLTVHHMPTPTGHLDSIDGIPTTGLERTAVDIGRRYNLPRALIVLDAAMRRLVQMTLPEPTGHNSIFALRGAVLDDTQRLRSRAQLEHVAHDLSGWPGIIRCRVAIECAEPAAESPLESYSRGVWIQMGLPIPQCGVPVMGADGRTYWADQLWEDFRVIGECDGLMKYADPDALRHEKLRQEALEQAGWVVVRWTWEEILYRPHVVAARLRAAFERGRLLVGT